MKPSDQGLERTGSETGMNKILGIGTGIETFILKIILTGIVLEPKNYKGMSATVLKKNLS